jgi:hypothetical protein
MEGMVKFYEIRREIGAPPGRVWAILTDARKLVAGDLGITRIDGDIAPGARLKLWTETAPSRAFALRVAAFEPGMRMVWDGGMKLGLFRGVRQFNLSAATAGTAFHMREEFSGLMLPLIWRSMPDLNPAFEKFATGLKTLAEA